MNSVCIATFNGEKFIADLISSILFQIHLDDEIIISDDGSNDSTLNIINRFNDKRIKIYDHIVDNNNSFYAFNKITRNFEYAISKSKGDIIYLVDQDDVWLTDKIKETTLLLQNKLLVLHDCHVINNSGEILYESYFKLNNSKIGCVNNIVNSSYLGCCMAFRRELLFFAFPFPNLPVPHDIWLGLIAEVKNEVVFCEKKLLLYRRHDNNQSSSGEKSKFSFHMKIKYRIIIVFSLIKRLIYLITKKSLE